MARKHFVEAGHRNSFRPPRRSGGEKSCRFVIDVVVSGIWRLAPVERSGVICEGGDFLVTRSIYDDEASGPVMSHLYRLHHGLPVLRLENQHFRAGILNIIGKFARAEPEADRAVHHVCLLGGDVGENEFRAVLKHHHYYVALDESVTNKGLAQTVDVRIQFFIGPGLVEVRVDHSRTAAVAPYVAHEAFDPGVMFFEDSLEVVHIAVFLLKRK